MNKRFEQIILMCQKARKKYGLDYEIKYKKYIDRFSKEIIENKLTEKCKDSYFAEQLCVMNELNWR